MCHATARCQYHRSPAPCFGNGKALRPTAAAIALPLTIRNRLGAGLTAPCGAILRICARLETLSKPNYGHAYQYARRWLERIAVCGHIC